MKTVKLSALLLVFIVHSACTQKTSLQQVEFLVGTWKIEGKQSYESWEKQTTKLIGVSYKITDGQKIISENIEVKIVGNQLVYTPTVFDQNEGKGIPFKLMPSEENLFSFENSEHDFPKKIQYRILNRNELHVSVLGKDDKGFSYKLIKQPH